ncbi:MAG: PAS domain S-box protein, partial [Bacilli bacterium]
MHLGEKHNQAFEIICLPASAADKAFEYKSHLPSSLVMIDHSGRLFEQPKRMTLNGWTLSRVREDVSDHALVVGQGEALGCLDEVTYRVNGVLMTADDRWGIYPVQYPIAVYPFELRTTLKSWPYIPPQGTHHDVVRSLTSGERWGELYFQQSHSPVHYYTNIQQNERRMGYYNEVHIRQFLQKWDAPREAFVIVTAAEERALAPVFWHDRLAVIPLKSNEANKGTPATLYATTDVGIAPEQVWDELCANTEDGAHNLIVGAMKQNERYSAETILHEAKYKMMTQYVSEAVAVIDLEGYVRYSNITLERFTGQTLRQLRSKQLQSLFSLETSDAFLEALAVARRGIRRTLTVFLRDGNGVYQWFELNLLPVISYHTTEEILVLLHQLTD